MELRILQAGDAAAFTALRLAALRECPTAFSSSYEEECDIPLEQAAERLAPDEDRAVFGAFDGDFSPPLSACTVRTGASSRTKPLSGVYTSHRRIAAAASLDGCWSARSHTRQRCRACSS
jgi:hypothetical protein